MLPGMKRSAFAFLAWLLLSGCSSRPDDFGTVILLTGEEGDTWSRDPAARRVEIDLHTASGTLAVGAAQAPAEAVTITNTSYIGSTATFEALGLDAADNGVVRGQSVPFMVDDLANFAIPLFVARMGQWARPSNTLDQARRRPLLALVRQQYLFAAGGDTIAGVDGSIPDVYDFGYWQMLHGQPRLARLPRSLATIANLLLIVDDAGATWLDVSTDGAIEATAPAGLTFAEIAGGATVQAPDGAFFIVGATRTSGEATAKILKVGADGKIEALTLAAARLGAAAAYIGGKLVVAGGSATGAGIEVLSQGQALVPLAYPPDPTVGMALGRIDDATVVLLGGTDPTSGTAARSRAAALSCTQACTTTELASGPLPLRQARAFPLGAGALLAVGDTDQGETQAYAVTASTASMRALPLREPRKGATAVALSSGQIALIGGDLLTDGSPARRIEIFTP
jgi:hypothetical protein